MKLALGTAQFGLEYGIANRGGRIPSGEAQSILERARACGMDTLDTAVAYGDSERRLGEMGIAAWRVVTKLPAIPAGVRDVDAWVRGAVGESLARLRIPRLYALLLHRPLQLVEAQGDALFRALLRVRDEGLVGRIGVSVYGPEELDALSRFDFGLVQAPFSIVDRRLHDSGWLERLAIRGTEIHARSIFLQGLLLMGGSRPARFARWSGLWTAWEAWLAAARLTPLQACLRYAASYPGIDRVVVGVDGLRHLNEIIDALDGPPPQGCDHLLSDDADLLNPARWPAVEAVGAA